MSIVQFDSVDAPLDRAGVGPAAARALGRAEAMGLLHAEAPIRHLNLRLLTRLLREVVRSSGIGRDAVATIAMDAPSPERISTALRRLFDELEHSPVPEHEWQALPRTLGIELLTELVGVSAASARRYTAGERTTPDAVADRLHFLALVVADLAGSYNEFGIRRWFGRPRPQLEGRRPSQLLHGDWRADQAGPQRVRELARALTGTLAT